jgi:HIRAN domain
MAQAPSLAGVHRLWVIWGEPDDGTRRVIGELWRDAEGFAFGYGHELQLALAKGFRMLPEFPESSRLETPYRAAYLFATFAQRLPSPKRGDFLRIIKSWGVADLDNPLEALALSGGIQMTDRIELAEYRAPDDDLSSPLLVRIAGMKKHHGATDIRAGADLALKREPENAYDVAATMFIAPNGVKAGYVPRQYSAIVARRLDAGHVVTATAVRQLSVPADEGRWVVRLSSV